MNVTKKKSRPTNIENKLVVTSGEMEEESGNIGVGGSEVQTIRCKISYKDVGKYNQYFLMTITFKNCDSLYCTPVTYIILYSN